MADGALNICGEAAVSDDLDTLTYIVGGALLWLVVGWGGYSAS